LITTTLLTAAGALAADAPATQPAAVAAAGPTTAPTTAPAEAIALLDRVNAQYGKLKSARFDGKVTGKFDVAGQSKNDDLTFSSTFRAPNQFRHDAVNDVLLGSTGEKVFAFERTHNQYLTADAPKDRSPLSDWPRIVPGILQQQNPSLLLALTKNSTDDLRDLGDAVKVLPDTTVAGVAYNTIQFDLPPDHEIVTMLFDPKTSLMRQAKFDLRQPLEKRGASDVKAAALKGSVVLLDFWATWCGPCVMSLPQLDSMYRDLGPKGLKAFAVNQEEDKDTVKAFANEKKLTIPMLLDLKGEASRPYGVEEGIPVTVIVGKDGIVKRAFAGTNDEIEGKIRQTLEKELGS
jgi:thiol-disulfide isomerase/thioredoxin